MSKTVLEDKIGPHLGHAAGDTDAEKKASQLASDVKYQVRKELGKDTSLNPAEIAKKYLQKLASSPAPPAVKLIAKKKLEGSSLPSSSSSSPESSSQSSVSEEAGGDDRVWIVVTDKKTGNTYRRSLRKSTAERKIAELRSNPNISRVERTSYHPGNKDDVQGKNTASVKAGKGLHPGAGERYEKSYGSSKGKNTVGDLDGDGTKEPDRHEYAGVKDNAIKAAMAKRKPVDEGFSNWRNDLREVVDDEVVNQTKDQIKEKKVENKITINPNLDLGEKIDQMGGQLIEVTEIEEDINFEGVLDEICDAELVFLSNEIIEESVEEFFLECLEEGYDIENVTEMLIESLDTSLEMICEVSDEYYSKIRRQNKIKKVKDTVKKVGKAVSYGAGYAARKAYSTAKKVGSEVKKGYEAAKETEKTSSSSGTRKPKTYRYAKKAEKKEGLASRLGKALGRGLRKAVVSGARSVSRGARNVARAMSEENIQEVAPPGFEGTVKAMKDYPELSRGKTKKGKEKSIYALSWWMKSKGFKSHKTKSGKDKVSEAVASPVTQQQQDTQNIQQKQKQQKLDQQKQQQNSQQQQQPSAQPSPMQRKLANIQKQQLSARLKQVQLGYPLADSYEIGEGRAMGSVSSSDTNPKGAAVRASSGRGMTMTPAKGLGASKSTANNPAADDLRRKYFDKQAKADRRAAARERAASGEDRVGRLIRSVQNSHYSPEGEMVDEARAEEKRGLGSTGDQRQRQKSGEEGPQGRRPVTSYSGGQNPHSRGKDSSKEQRRQSSRRYVDQPGGVYGGPESQQGAGRYAKMQARKRDQSHMSSRFD